MSFLSAEKVWNGDVQEYQFWFSCDKCDEPIFEGWPHWSNSEVPEEQRGYGGPTELPSQELLDKVHGTEHYCIDCGYKLGHISKREYVECSGRGVDPADVNVIETDEGELVLELTRHRTPRKPKQIKQRRASQRSPRQSISKSMRFDIYKKCGFRCQYCGVPASEAQLEIDHIVPLSKGGTNDLDNLAAACFDCNRGKADKKID